MINKKHLLVSSAMIACLSVASIALSGCSTSNENTGTGETVNDIVNVPSEDAVTLSNTAVLKGYELSFPAGYTVNTSSNDDVYSQYDKDNTINIIYDATESTASSSANVFEAHSDAIINPSYMSGASPHSFVSMEIDNQETSTINDYEVTKYVGHFVCSDGEDVYFVGYGLTYNGTDYWFYAYDNTSDNSASQDTIGYVADGIAKGIAKAEE